jgi:hypothetical protein
MKPGIIIFILLFVAPGVNSEIKITPTLNISLSGGGFYFEDEPLSFGEYINIDIVPSTKFNENSTLLVGYSGKYRGIRDVIQFTGGSAFYEEYSNHSVLLQFIRKIGTGFRIKPVVNYKRELYKETKEDNWDTGLYNYDRWSGRLEIDKTFDIDSYGWSAKNLMIGGGYDTGITVYPNPETIAARYEALGSTEFAKVDPKLFDYQSGAVYLKSELTLEKFSCRVDYIFTQKYYDGQKIVDELGQFTDEPRRDEINNLTAEAGWYFGNGVAASVEYAMTRYDSTQNHYDGFFTPNFTPGFYDYSDINISPVFSVRLNGIILSISYTNGSKNYSERLAQDESGNYGSEKIATKSEMTTFRISHDLFKGLLLSITCNLGKVSSNTRYEDVYRYNYDNFNFLAGIVYRYP